MVTPLEILICGSGSEVSEYLVHQTLRSCLWSILKPRRHPAVVSSRVQHYPVSPSAKLPLAFACTFRPNVQGERVKLFLNPVGCYLTSCHAQAGISTFKEKGRSPSQNLFSPPNLPSTRRISMRTRYLCHQKMNPVTTKKPTNMP